MRLIKRVHFNRQGKEIISVKLPRRVRGYIVNPRPAEVKCNENLGTVKQTWGDL